MAYIEKLKYQDLINNYELKTIKKLSKMKYPWIKDFKIDENEINNYTIIFINLIVNPKLLKEQYNWDYGWYIKSLAKRGPETIESYLIDREFLNLKSFMDDDLGSVEVYEVKQELSELFKSLKQNPAIPEDLKLPKSRYLDVDGFYIDPEFIEELKNDPEIVEED
jgi:hypothetical protein